MTNKGFSLLETLIAIAFSSLIGFTSVYALKELQKQVTLKTVVKELKSAISHESKIAIIQGKTRTAQISIEQQSLNNEKMTLLSFRKLLKASKFGSLESKLHNIIFFYPSGSNSAGKIILDNCEVIVSRYGAIRDTC